MEQQDLRENERELSPVEQMFEGRSVLITGATGFLGRVLIEKLLRCYPGIKRFYLLMRTKKGIAPRDRLQSQLFKLPIFDTVKASNGGVEQLLDKLVVVPGDIGLPQLGMSDDSLQMLLADTSLSVVFHSAATVRFDEPLKRIVELNLRATREIINLCKRLPNLISFCHVSTAFVNCHLTDNQDIEERVYTVSEQPDQLIKMAECMDEKLMEELKVKLLDKHPNTYTYMKGITECLVLEEAKDLPLSIVRPSIVVSAWKEPMPGWVDNSNGLLWQLIAWNKGLIRTLNMTRHCKADLIPVDVVINTMIASAFYAATKKANLKTVNKSPEKVNENKQGMSSDQTPATIFYAASGDLNPITFGMIEDYSPVMNDFPSLNFFRYPVRSPLKRSKHLNQVFQLLVHYLPAMFIDMSYWVRGKKQRVMPMYKALHKNLETTTYFVTTNFNFKSKNHKLLEAALEDERDRQTLYINIKSLDWRKFWHHYMLGARRWVLMEPDETLAEARSLLNRAYYKEIAFRLILVLCSSYLILPLGRSMSAAILN